MRTIAVLNSGSVGAPGRGRAPRLLWGVPLWAQLLIPLTILIVLALGADAWVFLTTTNATRAGILDQTLRDRPAQLRTTLADEANGVLEAAKYLARTGSAALAHQPRDLYSLQRSENDIYYRFNLDRYGFDLVRVTDPAGQILISVSTDPTLEGDPLAGVPAQGLTPTLTVVPRGAGLLLAGSAPIMQGGVYLGQAVVGRIVNGAYLTRLKQTVNGQVILLLDKQIYSSFPPATGSTTWPAAVQGTLDAGLAGRPGTMALTVGGRSYAATFGPVDLGGTPGAFAILVPTEDTDRLVNTGLLASLGTLSTTLALILVGALIFAATITRPVTELVRTAGAIRTGDLARRARVAPQGEIGVLGRTFNAMADTLGEVLSAERAGREHERARLTQHLSAAAGQLAQVAAGQALAAGQQVTAVGVLTTNLVEGGQALAAITRSAREVEQAARATLESAAEGEAISRDVAVAMDRLTAGGAAIIDELRALTGSLHQVQEAMRIVDEMSDTVHVLALNATIEASTAGPYGVRFAAVAKAVNDLAKQSQQETAQVHALVTAVLDAGYRAEAGAATGVAAIGATLPLVARSTATNSALAIRASRDLALVEEIRRAIDGLRSGGEESLRSVRRLQELARASARAGQEVTAGADQLEALARDLAHTERPPCDGAAPDPRVALQLVEVK